MNLTLDAWIAPVIYIEQQVQDPFDIGVHVIHQCLDIRPFGLDVLVGFKRHPTGKTNPAVARAPLGERFAPLIVLRNAIVHARSHPTRDERQSRASGFIPETRSRLALTVSLRDKT
jgi:hypothetical protein